ncbi:benzoate/H(+) symporter BenE family transporter [Raineyella sp. LH-20]|uniref:benzoate/H(+) symporter BenE family transporter n=1 Tax=Raineyella sp. LH-20 TaxID=3081204 RepID=UPI002953A19C|nr:benzoate/H(+) symporter BenE family transporter [Raineyella sp. LH-20]WOP20149.1 benzoate/H(+) symporter BenE family transporter [Raineyella sp. LH-20]
MRTFRDHLSVSAIVAGFVAVAISYAGPLLVVLQAARAAGLSTELTGSWVWAISVGSGVACLLGSIVTRQPIMIAWSIPGAAVLMASLADYSLNEAIGAYIVCGLLSALLGATGLIGRLLAMVPKPITQAVLAGVLMPFAITVAGAVVSSPVVAGGIVVGYLVGRRFLARYAVFAAMVLGGILSVATGATGTFDVHPGITVPMLLIPHFTVGSILGIAVPLFIVTQAGQNAPGLIVMRASGFEPNDRLLLTGSGIASIVFAFFGAHALNLAAVTAAIATSSESHPDKHRRYVAGISTGVFYIIGGFLAMMIVGLFAAIPPAMLTALAGVALLAPTQNALHGTMQEGDCGPAVIEAALVTLVVSLSGIHPFGIVAAFWGLLAGIVTYAVLKRRRLRA